MYVYTHTDTHTHTHYQRMLENSDIRARLKGKVSDAYIQAMIVGIDAWCHLLKSECPSIFTTYSQQRADF
jgi:hypothetical protein